MLFVTVVTMKIFAIITVSCSVIGQNSCWRFSSWTHWFGLLSALNCTNLPSINFFKTHLLSILRITGEKSDNVHYRKGEVFNSPLMLFISLILLKICQLRNVLFIPSLPDYSPIDLEYWFQASPTTDDNTTLKC